MASSRVNVQVNIKAPVADVFAFLIDLDRHRLWNTGLLEVGKTGLLREGMTYSTVSSLMGRTFQGRNRVSTLRKNQILGIENQSGPVSYSVTYELAAVDETTTMLACRCDISGQMSFFDLAAPLLEYLAQSRLEADLKMFQVLVEHGGEVQ